MGGRGREGYSSDLEGDPESKKCLHLGISPLGIFQYSSKVLLLWDSGAILPKASWSPNPKLISLHSKYPEGLLKIVLKRSDDGGSSPSSSSNPCMTWASSLPLSLSLLISKSGDKIEPTPGFALKMKGACWHKRNPLEEPVAVS